MILPFRSTFMKIRACYTWILLLSSQTVVFFPENFIL